MYSFQEVVGRLNKYWSDNGCSILNPYSSELGAATMHPATFFGALSKEKTNISYIQPVIRPCDGRGGIVKNRLYQHHQYQVLMKPSPDDLQDLYLKSLDVIGFDVNKYDIRFIEDNWDNPSIGAWGLGWEVWCDGMEITQFTYMQQIGGVDCFLVSGELAYGLERILMNLQNVDSVFDIIFDSQGTKYGDIFSDYEKQFSEISMNYYPADMLYNLFNTYKNSAVDLIDKKKPLVAYDFCIKISHILNLLDARSLISVTERAEYILLIRNLVKECALLYLE
ncbi:glycine--tRNA ligase subunit alpha [Anaplasmataceae bacterium AB001_6]|nr:glycine--tRNA ligase subunit alpha [Anaplasmataceae bacterium AB001_6]